MKRIKNQLVLLTTASLLLFIFGFTPSSGTQLGKTIKTSTKEINLKRVQAEVYINAPIEKVWKIVGENFAENSAFSVNAKKTYYLKEVDGMIGSQRRTVDYKDKIIDVEIVEYDANDKHVKWEIFNMNVAPLKAGNSSYTLSSDGKGGTVLVQKAAFKMKVFFMDWVAKGKFTTLFKTQLAAIKHFTETGESITPETKEDIVERYLNDIKVITLE
ncbi:MAG: SRPBCC family protein [Bacteroidia bacterium]